MSAGRRQDDRGVVYVQPSTGLGDQRDAEADPIPFLDASDLRWIEGGR